MIMHAVQKIFYVLEKFFTHYEVYTLRETEKREQLQNFQNFAVKITVFDSNRRADSNIHENYYNL